MSIHNEKKEIEKISRVMVVVNFCLYILSDIQVTCEAGNNSIEKRSTK